MSEINWPEIIGSLSDNDEALLALASCALRTSDNFQMMTVTGLAPGWISSQIGAWRSTFLLVGEYVTRKVALARFPVLAATFAALDAEAIGQETVAPSSKKPSAVVPVVKPKPKPKEKELAMDEQTEICTRMTGCTRAKGHTGMCPGTRIGKPIAPVAARASSAAVAPLLRSLCLRRICS